MEQRTCNKCNQLKPLTEFYKTGRKTDKEKGKRHYECKECTKKRVTAKHNEDPTKSRRAHLRRKYDISLEEYEQMLELQGNKCALCPATEPGGRHAQSNWCVDHDHVTGKVRELLCNDCNLVLGILKDSPEHLGRMITYILKHR